MVQRWHSMSHFRKCISIYRWRIIEKGRQSQSWKKDNPLIRQQEDYINNIYCDMKKKRLPDVIIVIIQKRNYIFWNMCCTLLLTYSRIDVLLHNRHIHTPSHFQQQRLAQTMKIIICGTHYFLAKPIRTFTEGWKLNPKWMELKWMYYYQQQQTASSVLSFPPANK